MKYISFNGTQGYLSFLRKLLKNISFTENSTDSTFFSFSQLESFKLLSETYLKNSFSVNILKSNVENLVIRTFENISVKFHEIILSGLDVIGTDRFLFVFAL